MTKRDRPRLVANFAMTVDGKISTRNRTPSTFTSATDKRRLLEIRAMGDAVMAGRATVAADTMSMTLKDEALQAVRASRNQAAEPLRVIVSGSGTFDPDWRVFEADGARRVLLTSEAGANQISARARDLADVVACGADKLDLAEGLKILRRDYRVRVLVCEGGPTLFRALLELDAVDELYLTVAPLIFGGADAPTVTGLPGEFLPECVRARCVECQAVEDEWYLKFQIVRSK